MVHASSFRNDNLIPHPRQNGRRFADDISYAFFVNEKFSIWIKISLKIVPNGPIDNKV